MRWDEISDMNAPLKLQFLPRDAMLAQYLRVAPCVILRLSQIDVFDTDYRIAATQMTFK